MSHVLYKDSDNLPLKFRIKNNDPEWDVGAVSTVTLTLTGDDAYSASPTADSFSEVNGQLHVLYTTVTADLDTLRELTVRILATDSGGQVRTTKPFTIDVR